MSLWLHMIYLIIYFNIFLGIKIYLSVLPLLCFLLQNYSSPWYS